MERTVRYRLHSVTFEWDADEVDEARDAAIGYAESQQLLFVVHLIRHEKITRIISARRATASESRLYEEL